MGKGYDKVGMAIFNLHGSPTSIDYVNINNLDSKNIDTLILLSCNAAHQDDNNIAYQFYKNNNIFQVIGADGTVYVKRRGIFNKKVKYEAEDDDYWDNYRKAVGAPEREHVGFVRYSKIEGDIPTPIGAEFDNIIDLIDAIKTTPYRVNNDLYLGDINLA